MSAIPVARAAPIEAGPAIVSEGGQIAMRRPVSRQDLAWIYMVGIDLTPASR